MSNSSDLRAVMYDIRQRLLARPAFIEGHGVKVDDSKYVEEAQVFEDLQARLSRAIKQWQAGKGKGKGSKDDEALQKEANELLRDVKRYAAKNMTIEPLEVVADKLKEITEEHEHEYHDHQPAKQYTELGPVDGSPHAPVKQHVDFASIEAIVLLLFVAIQGYRVHLKRNKKS